jgi:hypothetical protein
MKHNNPYFNLTRGVGDGGGAKIQPSFTLNFANSLEKIKYNKLGVPDTPLAKYIVRHILTVMNKTKKTRINLLLYLLWCVLVTIYYVYKIIYRFLL